MSKYRQLTQQERYSITALSMSGKSKAEIARLMDRHPSTIGREFKRNATTHDGMEGMNSYREKRPVLFTGW